MKPRFAFRSLLLASSILMAQYAHSATLYWDGTTSTANADGGAGAWNGANLWDDAAIGGANATWNSLIPDLAVFGGTAGAVTTGAAITTGGIRFDTTGYTITADSTNTLSFSGTSNILLNNIAAATITGTVAGAGNIVLSTSNPVTAGTLNLNGTSTGGWSGSTAIHAGTTLALSGLNQGLLNTSGITLSGGGITLTSADDVAQDDLDRVSDSAAITSNGGTITYTTTTAGSTKNFIETIGSITLNRGQLNLVNTLDKSAGSQTLALAGLSQTGTSAITFSNAGGLNTTNDIIRVNGITTSTTAGQIIGAWATTGTTAAAQTDYAVYNSDGVNGRVVAANIAATVESSSTWGSDGNVTLNAAATLTGQRNVNTLRYTGAAGTLDLSASNLSLQTNGILNGGSGTLTISTNATGLIGTGGLTTQTGGGNLYLTAGNAAITVSAPINDNGGAVTLVQSGSGNITLSSRSSSFSGGIVLNAGQLIITNDANLGNGGGITVNGTATINGGDIYNYGRTLTLNEGGVLTSNNGFGVTGVFSGNGALNVTSADDHNFTNRNNTFTGAITSATAGSTGYGLTFASIGDTVGAGLINLQSGGTFRWTSDSGTITTLTNRQFAISSAGTGMISALGTGSSALVISKDLLITGAAGARTLTLAGTNTALNTFAGNISDGDGSVVSLTKDQAGTWALSGTNTYSGNTNLTAVSGSRLIFQGSQALSPNTKLIFAQSSSAVANVRFLDDGAGTINFNRPIEFGGTNTSQVLGIFVGNNNIANQGNSSGTTTGSTIQVGAITHTSIPADINTWNINVTGANDYRLRTGTITLNNLTNRTAADTVTTVLNPTSANMTVDAITMATGNITAADGIPVLRLDGTSSDNIVSGAISNASDFATGHVLSLQKQNTSTWTLQGTNTYTGTTAISGGKLLLSGTGSLHASSAVTVSGGFLGGTGTVNGSVTVSSTGGLDLRDGAVGTLILGSTLGITGAAGANNLHFDLGNTTATSDSISVAGATTVTTAGSAVININQLGGLAGRSATTYTLIGGAGTLAGADFAKFSLATTAAFGQTYALTNTGDDLQLVATNVISATPAAFWKGGANNWSTTSNWNTDATSNIGTGAAPDYQTNVTFNTTTPVAANLTTNVLDVDFDINSLNFNAAAGGVTIGGTKMLTIEATNANGNTAGNGIDSSNTSGTNTISAKVGLASSQTWTVASGGTLAVSGAVTDFGGGYGLTKAGAGTLTLTGTNSYSGGTTISGGAIRLTSETSIGGSTGGITFSNSGALLLNSGTGVTYSAGRTVTLSSGATAFFGDIGINGTITTQIDGKITGDGAIHFGHYQLGSAIVNLTNTANDFKGSLRLGGTSTFGGTTYSSLTVNAASLADSATANGNIIFGQGNGSSGNTATFNWTGSGPLTLDNRQIQLDQTVEAAKFANNGLDTVVVNTNLAISRAGAKTFILGGTNTGDNTFAGTINDSSSPAAVISLTKQDAGKWVLTNANGYTGATTITTGTLQLGNGGTTGSLTGTASIANNATLTINRSNAFTQATDLNGKIISGTGALNLNGSGGVTLSLANTFSGATNVNAGTLTLTNNSALQNSALTVNPSATLALGVGVTTPTIGGLNGNTNLSAVSGYSNVTALTLNPQTGVTSTYTGILSDGATGMNLVKSGAGTQVLSGLVNYTGTTTINAGTLLFGLGNLSGGTITLNANNATLSFATAQGGYLASGLGGATISNAIALSSSVTTSANLYLSNNSGSFRLTGGITGGATSGSQTLAFDSRAGGTVGGDRNVATIVGVISDGTGGGKLNLSFAITPQTLSNASNNHPTYVNLAGANTFTGTLTATRANTGATSWLTIGGERWSDGGNTTPTYGRMGTGRLGDNNSGVYAGTINFGSTATNIVNLNYFSSANQTWSGVIGGGANNQGALVKEGSGTLTLTNANGWSSLTTIGGGTLLLGFDTTTSNILPSTTPLWMGLGTIYDPITANADMTISGGGGGGTLQLGGAAVGASTQTVASLNTAANTANGIVVGENRSLIVSSATVTTGANSAVNFNTLAGGNNGATVGTSIISFPSAPTLTNGYTVTDAGGFGLATTNGSFQIIRDTSTGALPTSGGTSPTNYLTTSSTGNSVTTSQSAGSITTDTTGGNVSLTLSGGVTLSNNVWNFGGVGSNTALVTGGTGVNSVASGNTISINNYNTGSVTFSSPILANGANALIVGGTGTVSLAGLNTFTGATTINSGNLQISGSGRLVAGTYAGAIAINGGSVFQYSSDQNQTLSGAISGPGGITKDTSNASDLTLSSVSNIYTGNTSVSAGRIVATATTNLSNGGTRLVQSGTGQFYLNVAAAFANPVNISSTGYTEAGDSQNNTMAVRMASGGVLANTVTLSGDSRIGLIGNGAAGVTGKITGSYGIDFYGASQANSGNQTFTISNTGNDYTGNTSIISSLYNNTGYTGVSTTLKLGQSNVIPNGASAGNVVFAINGTNPNNSVILDLAGFNETINGVTVNAGANAVITNSVSGSSVLQIGANNTTSSFGGAITDSGAGKTLAITKIGSGALTISGSSNTYTGATSVNQGTLVVNGNISTSSLTTVAAAATLGGSGTLGAVTIDGRLAPGNSIGTITATGDVIWNDNDDWAFELGLADADLASASDGSDNDLLNITGGSSDFVKGTGSSFTFDFNGGGAVGWYKLVDWQGTTSFVDGDFAWTNLDSGLSGSFTVDAGTSALYLTVIPEPGAALLGSLGMLLILRRRRD